MLLCGAFTKGCTSSGPQRASCGMGLIIDWTEAGVRSGNELVVSFIGPAPRCDAAFLEGAVAVTFRGEVELDALWHYSAICVP